MHPRKNRWVFIMVGVAMILLANFTLQTQAADDNPIKVGVPIPLTGSMAYDGQIMRNAALMAIEEINAEGGLLGRQLKLVTFDSKELLAETFALAAEELIEKQKVDVLVCGYAGEAGIDTFGKYDVPFFHGEPSEYVITELVAKNPAYKENVFAIGDTTLHHGPVIFDAIMELTKKAGYTYPNKKIAVIRGSWTAIQQLTEGMTQRAEELGWETAFVLDAPEGTREWGGVMMRIRSLKPGLIIFNLWDVTAMAQFRDQFGEAPTKSLIFMGEGLSAPEYVILRGKMADGELGYTTKGVLPNAKGKEWRAKFSKRFNIPQKEIDAAAGYQDGTTYAGIQIWAEAVKMAGDPSDYKAVAQALKTNTFESIIGTQVFDENNRATMDGVPFHLLQVQDGKIVALSLNDDLVEGTTFLMPSWLK